MKRKLIDVENVLARLRAGATQKAIAAGCRCTPARIQEIERSTAGVKAKRPRWARPPRDERKICAARPGYEEPVETWLARAWRKFHFFERPELYEVDGSDGGAPPENVLAFRARARRKVQP